MHTQGTKFTTGNVQIKESLFNKDVFIQWRRVINHRYYTHLFSLECLNTGFTDHCQIRNTENQSASETVNKVVTDHWIYSKYGDRFGKPQNAFFTPKKGGDDLRSLRIAGEPESDLKPHFRFSEFLNCKYVQ